VRFQFIFGDRQRALPGALAILWVCFLTRGGFFSAAMPLWEPADEYSHFAQIANVSLHPLISEAGAVPTDITASFELVPLPKAMLESLAVGSHQGYETYWSLGEETRAALQAKLRNLPPANASSSEPRWLFIYEHQQPPLYYWVAGPVYWFCRNAPLTDRVFILRLVGVLLASIVVVATYRVAEFLGGRVIGLSAAALLVAMPQLLITASRVGNEAMAICIGSWVICAALRLTRTPDWPAAIALGFALSAALLTKAYFLSTFAVLLVWFGVRFRTNPKHLRLLLPVLALPIAVSGWWYVRNLKTTGSLSGEQLDAAAHVFSWTDKIRASFSINWLHALDSTMTGHTFACGWSLITVRSWMYHSVSFLWLMALIGVVSFLIQSKSKPGRQVVGLALSIYGAMMTALAYHVLVSFMVLHHAATSGSYLFSVATAEGVLLVAGVFFVSRRYGVACIGMTALLLASIDLFGMNFYALPYYAGLTGHLPSGGLPAWNMGRWAEQAGLLFQHLAVNKPVWLSSGGLRLLWVLYVLATVGVPFFLLGFGIRFAVAKSRLQQINHMSPKWASSGTSPSSN
jgi:4-amino-4-deoxy-L-arabinose transferase-like glycosyltransferase